MPPPILSPPPLHFLIIDFTTTCGINQFVFECETDAPCHLTLHLSLTKPIIRRIPYQKRGADFELSSVTCFVVTESIDQDQAGDTTTHTFTVPLTAYYMPHYWYLTGTHSGTPSKSISQIFNIACPLPSDPTPKCNAIATPWSYAEMYNCTDMSSAFQPTINFTATSVDIRYGTNLHYRQCFAGRLWIWNAASNGRPSTILAGPINFTPPDMGSYQWNIQNIPLPNVPLAAGNQYAIAWGWRDRNYPDRYMKMRWARASGRTCPLAPPPSKYLWIRRYYRKWKYYCLHLVADWYSYTYSDNLYYKFYGLPP